MGNKTEVLYSLRQRLTLVMAVGFLVILSLISIGLWSYARASANGTYDLLLEGASISIAERLSLDDGKIFVDLPPAAHEILALSRNDRVFYRIFSIDGKTITGASDLPVPPSIDPGYNQFYDANFNGDIIRFSIRYRQLISAEITTLVGIQIGQTRSSRNTLQWDIFSKGMIGLAFLAAVSLLFSRIAITIALRPLLGVVDDITRRSPSDFVPLRLQPPREIAGLIRAINRYMDRLKTSRENAEQFIADVAHQMRTSLSTLAANFHAAEDMSNAEDRDKALDRASRSLEQTIGLTNQLLIHAMIKHRQGEIPYEDVDLAQIIRKVIERKLVTEGGDEIEFDFSMDPTLQGRANVRGDLVSLREAIENVVSNSIQHSTRPLKISISIAANDANHEELEISFSDSGPGIALSDRKVALERFRASGPNAGSGIGLSIVAEVVHFHGGGVELLDSELGGLKVILFLPREAGRR